MADIHRLSTAAVAPAQRLAYWKNIFGGGPRPISIDAEPDGFEGAFTRLSAGQFEITSVKSTPLISRSAASVAGDETRFSLQLVHSGHCRMHHGEAEFVAETGDMFVVDAAKSYELAFARPVQGLVLSIPWSRFRNHAAALEALAGRPMRTNAGSAAVLSGFIRSAWDQLVEREGEEWPDSASEVIWDLLAAILAGDHGADLTNSRARHLRGMAAALIDDHLADPEFRSGVIAEGLGVSARYLQLVFAEAGTTPSRFLLARRLDAAAARLRCPDKPGRITDVALEHGFCDLSYFSRAFRRRFGISARRYQQRRGL